MTKTVPSTTEENLNLAVLAKEAGIALVIQTEFGIYEYGHL